MAEHVLRDPAHADGSAEQTAVGSEAHEVGVVVARVGHQDLIGVAREDPQVGHDPEPLRMDGRPPQRRVGVGLDVGIVRPIGLDDVDDVERGAHRRGDPGALPSRLFRPPGAVGPDEDARQTGFVRQRDLVVRPSTREGLTTPGIPPRTTTRMLSGSIHTTRYWTIRAVTIPYIPWGPSTWGKM